MFFLKSYVALFFPCWFFSTCLLGSILPSSVSCSVAWEINPKNRLTWIFLPSGFHEGSVNEKHWKDTEGWEKRWIGYWIPLATPAHSLTGHNPGGGCPSFGHDCCWTDPHPQLHPPLGFPETVSSPYYLMCRHGRAFMISDILNTCLFFLVPEPCPNIYKNLLPKILFS